MYVCMYVWNVCNVCNVCNICNVCNVRNVRNVCNVTDVRLFEFSNRKQNLGMGVLLMVWGLLLGRGGGWVGVGGLVGEGGIP